MRLQRGRLSVQERLMGYSPDVWLKRMLNSEEESMYLHEQSLYEEPEQDFQDHTYGLRKGVYASRSRRRGSQIRPTSSKANQPRKSRRGRRITRKPSRLSVGLDQYPLNMDLSEDE